MAKTLARKVSTVQGISFESSSGNVFADLGLAEPEELKTKLVLAVRLNERIKALGHSPAQCVRPAKLQA
jgi:hypothetical protein